MKLIRTNDILALLLLSSAAFAAESPVLTLPSNAELQLGEQVSVGGSIRVPAGFHGKIALSADASNVDTWVSVEPATIAVDLSASPIDLSFQVHFQTSPESHSFVNRPIRIIANPAIPNSEESAAPVSQTLALTVHPIYEIDLTGGPAPEGWSSPQAIAMPKHDLGATIRFVNLDPRSTHTIHGEGAIPHQDTNNPLAPATPGQPGGVYEIQVPAGEPTSGAYRCHDHESEDMLRTITFNN